MKSLTVFLLVLLVCSAEALFGQGTTVPRNSAAPNDGIIGFPNEISYQGLLTTSTGTPAADGSYNLQFDIFNVPGGGLSLWTETQTGVSVVNGVFSVRLGSVTPLPKLFYQVTYLEIAALAGPGISGTVIFSPRTQLAAAAFSLAPWYTQGTDISSPPFGGVLVGTDTADGWSKLLVKSHSRYAGKFTSDSLASAVHVVHAEETNTGASDVRAVYGRSVPQDWWGYGGEFVGGYRGVQGSVNPTGSNSYYGVYGFVNGGTGGNWGVLGVAAGGSSNYGVYGMTSDSAGNYAGYFNGRLRVLSASGDSGAMLPDNSISAPEVLDEPGIASHSAYNSVAITSAASVDSVTITIPAGGYIVLEAGGLIEISHVTATTSNVWVNTSETRDVTPGVPGFQWDYILAAQPTGLYPSNFVSHRVFSKTAGTYTFYLNASLQAGAGSAQIRYIWMNATYYPTSYGPVTALAQSGNDGFSGAASSGPAGAETASPTLSSTQEVDLRGLEIEALRARAQADAAERALLEARMAKEREKQEFPDQR